MPYAKAGEQSYDAETSGQLVLDEANLVVSLAPGDMIFFPSGLFTHWNMRLQPHEKRNSATFFCGANLANWADHDCKPAAVGSSKRVMDPRSSLKMYEAGI